MNEFEKMSIGKIYDPNVDDLFKVRNRAHHLVQEYNNTFEEETEKREKILNELMPNRKEGTYLQGPIFFDYGLNITAGKNFYANFNFTCLDCAKVTIGDNVFLGPNVSILTPMHPFMHEERNPYIREDGVQTDQEYAKPITIGSNTWICGNVTIVGGVTIGEGCVIGAGSVVTRNIPPHSLACGNPCRVIREINEKDSIKYRKELF